MFKHCSWLGFSLCRPLQKGGRICLVFHEFVGEQSWGDGGGQWVCALVVHRGAPESWITAAGAGKGAEVTAPCGTGAS